MTGSMLYDTEENKTQVCDKDFGFNSKTKIKTIFIQVFTIVINSPLLQVQLLNTTIQILFHQ